MFIYILFGLFVLGSGSSESNADYIINELPCIIAGGTCMAAADCPLTPDLLRSYCPVQQNSGVVCCHGISNKKTKCHERGGECMKGCPTRYIERKATDCEDYETCCILIK